MKLMILALLILASASMAGLALDMVESDFGHGCQYYTYTNTLASAKAVAAPASEIVPSPEYKASSVTGGRWFAFEEVERERQVWDSESGCHPVKLPCDPKNFTEEAKEGHVCDAKTLEYEREECGEWVPERFMSWEWIPFKSVKQLPPGKTRVKYCATYSMVPAKDGGWHAEFDMVPTFDGVRYPEYAWFNASWQFRQKCPYNASNVTENLNYAIVPCLINSTALIAAGKMNGTCKDIRAVDDDEVSALAYTIENGTCNSSYYNTTVFAGVNVTANTTGYFYIYYGNNASADAQDAATLYTQAGIMSIWHGSGSGDDGQNLNDVTSTHSSAGTTTNSSRCWTGGCFNYTTGNGYWTDSSATHPTGAANRTVSMRVWTNQNLANYMHLYDMGTLTTGNAETFYYKTTDTTIKYGQYAASEDSAIVGVYLNAFTNNVTYIAYRVNGATSIDAWMDRVKKSTSIADTAITAGRINIGGAAEEWGENGPAAIDEVRLYNTTKSDAWIEAEYSLFALAENEEDQPTSVGPEILNLTLTPASPYTTDSLICAFYARDNDSAVLNLTAMWYVNGVFSQNSTMLTGQAANATYSFTLLSGNTSIGENWSCTGYATDGTDEGTASSGNVTIGNRAPSIAMTLVPVSPAVASTLICTAVVSDADGGALSGLITWHLNGTATAYNESYSGTSGAYSANLSGIFSVGENWSCHGTVTDGIDSASAFSVNRTISGRATSNFTVHNITYDDFTGQTEAHFTDYGPYYLAILCYAFAFMMTRRYPQTLLIGGVGLTAIYFMSGNGMFLAGAILSTVLSYMYKQVVG